MCGRYTLKSRADVVAGVFGVPVPSHCFSDPIVVCGVPTWARESRRISVETTDQRRLTLLSERGCQEAADLLAADLRTVVALAESRTAAGSTRIPLDDELPADFCGT